MNKPLVPHTPTIGIDYDKYGHCVLCHRYLIIQKVIEGQIVDMHHPDYQEEEFLLDDNTRMRVAMCRTCRENLTDKDSKKIMKAVIKGWETEVQYLPWTAEKKNKYLKKYSKRKILMKSTGLPPHLTERAFKKHEDKKNKGKK